SRHRYLHSFPTDALPIWIPKRLRELVQAGLHKHRDDRPASVDVVIDELTQLIEPASTRRVSLGLVAGALIFGVGLSITTSTLARSEEHTSELQSRGNPVC